MNTHISETTVKAAKPPASGYVILFDDKDEGFGVRVTAAGAKSFILNYRVGREKRRMTIGKWPQWTADAARNEVKKKLLPRINEAALILCERRRRDRRSRSWPTSRPSTSSSTP